jgi:Flp pilus assembly protein TadG
MILAHLKRRVSPRWRGNSESSAGAATVELALILPVLVLIMLGLLDMGRVFYGAITVVNSARAGVSYGSRNVVQATDTAGMIAAAQADAVDVTGLQFFAGHDCQCASNSPPAVACTVTTCIDGSTPLMYVWTRVEGTFSTTLPYPGIPNSITLTRTARMRAQ